MVSLLNQSSRGLVSKLSPYQPKDAVYLPTGGIFLFEDQRSGLTLVTTTGRYSFSEGKVYDVLREKNKFNRYQISEKVTFYH
uniref:IncH1 plasmid conjugative transfer thiol:disulfide interchange protein HtdT n=1 Tax=Klebsiella pneumoniae TaxID=573 RepID=A0A8B0SSY1_KLEPN|nr:IncH1 plasmid conjugative transfer thiol:disulfide interchange protein HtdT [Klebsiella pneumoniae]